MQMMQKTQKKTKNLYKQKAQVCQLMKYCHFEISRALPMLWVSMALTLSIVNNTVNLSFLAYYQLIVRKDSQFYSQFLIAKTLATFFLLLYFCSEILIH